MTSALILDWRPEDFAPTIGRFPEVAFHLAETVEEARSQLAGTDILVTVGREVTREVVAQMPALKWMHSLIAGVDGAVSALADRPDVLLTSTRGIHGPQMAEAALCHMLCLARDVPRSIAAQRQRRWERWDPLMLAGKTVGIVGIGVVGTHLARTCDALGMTVYGISRRAHPVPGISRMFSRAELADAASEVDFLVLTVPIAQDTIHLVGAAILDAMKPTAYLINLARGAVVDTDALLAALRAGAIAGAGLDAFDPEPLPPDSPLWTAPNVFLTAHIAGRSDRYVFDAMTIFEPNLRSWLAGDLTAMRNTVAR